MLTKRFCHLKFKDNWERTALRLALDGWLKMTIFGNLSSFIRRRGPSHLNLYLLIALESEIEEHFSHSLLFDIRSVSRVPKKNPLQFFRVFLYCLGCGPQDKVHQIIRINGDLTQSCLTPDLLQNPLLSLFLTLTAAVLFPYISLITLIYLFGIPHKDKTFAKALLSAESNACS